jgi:CHAT domain-containing protein/TPR repeat protein
MRGKLNGRRRVYACMVAYCFSFALLFLNVLAISNSATAALMSNAARVAASEYPKRKKSIKHRTSPRENRRNGDDLLSDAVRLRSEWKEESLRIALVKYRSGMSSFEEAGNKVGEAKARLGAGEVLATLGEQDEALSQYRRGLQIVSSSSDARLEVDILNRVAEIEFDKGDRACELHAQRSLELAERASYASGQASALNNLGLIAYGKSDLAKPISYFNRALSLSSTEGNLAGQAEAWTNLGLTYGDSGSVNRAEESFDRALAFARAAGDLRKEARISLAFALVHTARAEWQHALDLYQRTVTLLRQFGDRVTLAVALNGLGSLYEELGEVSQSLANFKESLALSHKMGHQGLETIVLRHIASAYAEAGHEPEALCVYRRVIRIARVSRDLRVEAYALTDVGLIYESLGNFEKARSCYDRAILLGKSLHHPRVQAYSLARLGALYLRMNKPKEARAQQDAALALMKQAGDQAGEALILYNIARLKQHQGEIDSALADTHQIIQAAEAQRTEVRSSDLKASYFGSIHRNYELLIDLLMEQHTRQPAGGHSIAALEASELGHARSLGEMLTQARANLREGVPAELLEKESVALVNLRKKADEEMALRESRFKLTQTRRPEGDNQAEKLSQNARALESVSHEITELTARLDQATTEITANMPRKYASLLRAPRVSLKQLQDMLLDSDSLALEYSLGEDRSYLWIIGPNSLTNHVLPGRAEIDREAHAFYEALTSISKDRKDGARPQRSRTNLTTFNAARDTLSRTLLAPLEGIVSHKRLVIVPDGALEYIPFGALAEPGSNQPLVVAHELAMLPSLSVLLEMREEISNRPSAPKTLAVLADPVVEEHDLRLTEKRTEMGSRSRLRTGNTRRGLSAFEGVRDSLDGAVGVDDALNLVRLPFAAEEAAILTTLVPESDRLVATGFDANRQTASSEALSQFRIIHFATHGLLDFKHPRLSCLVLSRFDQKGEPQDGYLRLQDVYNMKLAADLVVLSACQTALGKEIRGEGLVGLTRGFFYAGAARVVASLWNVDDNASAKLMERFYRKMLGPEKVTASAALRAAQIEMMREKRWEDPYYWAAFVLQGEWR